MENAQVNFGAAKITVTGDISIAQLEDAGAFEGLKFQAEHDTNHFEKTPWWKNMKMIHASMAIMFIVIGLSFEYGVHASPLFVGLLYSAAILSGGLSLFRKGIANLRRLRFDMNTLMTIAIIGAAIIGEWKEAAIVVFLFAISELLESYSMEKARSSISDLLEIAPKQALIKRANKELHLSIDAIEIGDIMMVKPGEKIAMDGVVIAGESTVNQAPITGEAMPVYKTVGAEAFAGTLNEEGYLEIEVTKTAKDTTIAKIIHLVEEAQAQKAPSERFVDRFAKYYTPAILGIAFAISVLPPLIGGAAWNEWIYRGLAVLVVGCPCALVVSTPVAIVTAIGNAAKNGVLIKGGVHLEQAGQIKTIAFDKTGTLTEGKPSISTIISLQQELSDHELLKIAAALEKNAHHPLAKAIVTHANSMGIFYTDLKIDQFVSLTGKGVQATIDNVKHYIGSFALIEAMHPQAATDIKHTVVELQDQGKTVIVLATDDEILGLIAAADTARSSAKNVIARLHKLGIKTAMLTGDNKATGKALAQQLTIENVHAELLPDQKRSIIHKLKLNGKTAMIGDGINDAPALAIADTSIAMGGAGTDTAIETADITLMADDLRKLPFMITLSRNALKIIKQNITFSLGIKLAALLLIFPGWLTLWIAIFADMGATLLVTLNALRLLRVKPT